MLASSWRHRTRVLSYKIQVRGTWFHLNFRIQLQFLPLTNSNKTQLQQNLPHRSNPIQSTPAKPSSQFWFDPSNSNRTQVRSEQNLSLIWFEKNPCERQWGTRESEREPPQWWAWALEASNRRRLNLNEIESYKLNFYMIELESLGLEFYDISCWPMLKLSSLYLI